MADESGWGDVARQLAEVGIAAVLAGKAEPEPEPGMFDLLVEHWQAVAILCGVESVWLAVKTIVLSDLVGAAPREAWAMWAIFCGFYVLFAAVFDIETAHLVLVALGLRIFGEVWLLFQASL